VNFKKKKKNDRLHNQIDTFTVRLLAVYHILLEKKKIHQFNRFYLCCLVFSLSIPFITIEVIQESISPLWAKLDKTRVTTDHHRRFDGLLAYCALGLICHRNFGTYNPICEEHSKLTSRIKSNPAIDYKNSKLVLLKENTPYTLYSSKTDYRKIEAELYTHELIHVTKKHTRHSVYRNS
jgi:hypothetical protein